MSNTEHFANDQSQLETTVSAFKGHVFIQFDRCLDIVALSPEQTVALARVLIIQAGKAMEQNRKSILADS